MSSFESVSPLVLVGASWAPPETGSAQKLSIQRAQWPVGSIRLQGLAPAYR